MRIYQSLCVLLTLVSLPSWADAEPPAELIFALKGSIVKIHTVTKSGGHGIGSGVVVAENLVATNCHVLADANGINVAARGETYAPVSVREDWRHDICVLRVEYLPLKPVVLGDDEQLQYEQDVFAIGFPGGPPKPQTTFGTIKALYPLDDAAIIRTSSSFVLGASGSALFDSEGKLIGLNTFKSPGRHSYYYSMPVKWIKALLQAPETEHVSQNGRPLWDAPENQRPYLMRVVIPMQNEEWDDLLRIASEWAVQEPQTVEAIYYKALAEEHLGDLKAADALYRQVLQANPRHSASLLADARIARQQGESNRMLTLLSQLQALSPDMAQELIPQEAGLAQ
ncbi:S1 family peptidase [Methylovorus glucosotrophus]|uniref:Peptidase S1 and S6 chymotrypsin/Hap n=1 Tax=Methylovorus glucosotrophus (strain SIP3-4) TaxID=582744 RepID=C6XBL7_METGS|nr:serine protease [Methylovorus glucosotrophus]ACT51987.1 peptidase S1 and S6 chymotrypsin/Hap [Methylovorus glucosotrophus SIP3-4]